MVMVAENTTTKSVGKETCQHHWMIEPADGKTSIGVCKQCGEWREFNNYIVVESWVDDIFKIPSLPRHDDIEFDRKLARYLV